jgi:CheY-like chemotaxis protein
MTADGITKTPPQPGPSAWPPEVSSQSLNGPPLNGMRILIAEDTWHTAVSLQRTVQRAGARIAGMASTLADLERLACSECDAVIMDLNLNGQMAHETAGRLATRGLKVIVLSGYRRPQSLDPGIHAFLEKPSSNEALIAALLAPPRTPEAPPSS